MSIHNRLFAGSVAQHFLLSYRTSLAAVCRAQLDHRKRLHVSGTSPFSAVHLLAAVLPCTECASA